MKEKNDVINILIDTKKKEKAMKILKEQGYTMTDAITLFLKEVIKYNGIPFELVLESKDNKIKGD